MVRYITELDEWNTLMETSNSKLVVVDFTASWCGPCRYIGPIFEKLAEENPEVEFVKVDGDDAEEIAEKCQIRAFPAFHFYRRGEKIDEMLGADQNKLMSMIAKLK